MRKSVHIVCYFHIYVSLMNGSETVKFASAQQAKQTYRYKNTKEKLYKSNAAIWDNKTCRQNI